MKLPIGISDFKEIIKEDLEIGKKQRHTSKRIYDRLRKVDWELEAISILPTPSAPVVY